MKLYIYLFCCVAFNFIVAVYMNSAVWNVTSCSLVDRYKYEVCP